MTRHDVCGPHCCGREPAGPSPAPRRRSAGGRSRPVLTLVPRPEVAREAPVPLSSLTRHAMPPSVRGAVVAEADRGLVATWMPSEGPFRVPPGRILLSWTQAAFGRTDVRAHLGLAGTQVLLAYWPGLRGEWSAVVRPTVVEVSELHAALRLATRAGRRWPD